jgi:hypothetical protein
MKTLSSLRFRFQLAFYLMRVQRYVNIGDLVNICLNKAFDTLGIFVCSGNR